MDADRKGDLFRLDFQDIRPGKAEFRARRKPRLLFRFDGLFLLRFADRQFLALLFQLPPRLTRFEPLDRPPFTIPAQFGEIANF